MPTLSVWMIRTSLIYLLLAVSAGGLLLSNKGILIDISVWNLLQVHIEIALFGWLLQFILGTAYWMLPRFLEGPKRGNKKLGWSMMLLLNAGIWFYIFSYLKVLPEGGALTGRILEFAAVAIFIMLHWNRIVAYQRSH